MKSFAEAQDDNKGSPTWFPTVKSTVILRRKNCEQYSTVILSLGEGSHRGFTNYSLNYCLQQTHLDLYFNTVIEFHIQFF